MSSSTAPSTDGTSGHRSSTTSGATSASRPIHFMVTASGPWVEKMPPAASRILAVTSSALASPLRSPGTATTLGRRPGGRPWPAVCSARWASRSSGVRPSIWPRVLVNSSTWNGRVRNSSTPESNARLRLALVVAMIITHGSPRSSRWRIDSSTVKLVAVPLREVEHDGLHRRQVLAQLVDGALGAVGPEGDGAGVADHPAQQLARVLVVVDDQDAEGGRAPVSALGLGSFSLRPSQQRGRPFVRRSRWLRGGAWRCRRPSGPRPRGPDSSPRRRS